MPKRTVSKPAPNRTLWICAAIVAATFAVYAQTARFGFVNYDDPDYVKRDIHVLSTEAANWFPVTRLSHLVDVQLFGFDAGIHHLENAALHAAAAVLLFLFLLRATGAAGASAFVAFVFALHPLHVESVAWISERKDVLCALFWFLALWAYVRGRNWLLIVAFVLGLLSKPMIVTLPLTLMLLDIWPLRRGVRIVEKWPLFAISAAGAVVTFAVQHAAGAVKPSTGLALANALVSYVVYIVKTVWPSGLAVFYPYPAEIPLWEAALAALALAAITYGALRRPWLTVGWFWFLITLLPVIGIVQVGAQARADRYMYVPMVGLAIVAAWGAPEVLRKWPIAAAACAALAAVAWVQTSYWENSGTLFAHAIEVTRNNYIAEHNLGTYLMEQPGQLDQALPRLREAVRLRPESGTAHSDLGSALARVPGRSQEAIAELQAAARLLPDAAIPHNNLANALSEAGRFPEAVTEYQVALRLKPDYAEAVNNLAITRYQFGLALAHDGKAREAAAQFEEALRLKPDYPEAQNNLGVVLSQIPGRELEAAAHFREALRLRPDYEDARFNLGLGAKK